MLLLTLLSVCTIFIRISIAALDKLPISNDESLLWGPYRPNLYFGIRPRIPESLLMGLMWSSSDDVTDMYKNLRHTCEQDEGMASYGWITYDSRTGGVQTINDTRNNLDLSIEFVKASPDGGSQQWGLRIRGLPRRNARPHHKTAMIFYVGSESLGSEIVCSRSPASWNSAASVGCNGSMGGLGNFNLHLPEYEIGYGSSSNLTMRSLTVPPDMIWRAKEIFLDSTHSGAFLEEPVADKLSSGNIQFVQQSFENEFQFDVFFSSGLKTGRTSCDLLTQEIQNTSIMFHNRFRSVYPPKTPFQDQEYIRFSQSLLSNLMGGIGYFYGTSMIDDSHTSGVAKANKNLRHMSRSVKSPKSVTEQGPYELFSAVPSRPFFPRGFLWDEGFHLQVILDWDMDLALEIILSWFNLMDEDGWIAREQILGPEARSKVPEEFQVQHTDYANPPTLFIVIQEFIARLDGIKAYSGAPSKYLDNPQIGRGFVEAIFPRMKQHYNWFRRTQAGTTQRYSSHSSEPIQGYRWRGRTPQHILTSGLDDYPRPQPPHPEELHLDALCWVGLMASILNQTATFLEEHDQQIRFSEDYNDISRSIEEIYWSETDQAYCDTTVSAQNQVVKVCHKGYVSLFPFLVGFIGPDHTHFDAILDLITDRAELWSPYGIRSLSCIDEYYGTQENYWRSPIWININYMIVQKLLDLSSQPGPHQNRIKQVYSDLRTNLCTTVYKSWKETGFAWEQYNPDNGRGQRTQHFTGWTALVVKILAMPDLDMGDHVQPTIPKETIASIGIYDRGILLFVMPVVMVSIVYLLRRKSWRWWRRLR